MRNIDFGSRFRMFRIMSGMSQKEVAGALGIMQSNVSDWENSVSRPEYENLIALAALYGETVDELLGSAEIETQRTRGGVNIFPKK